MPLKDGHIFGDTEISLIWFFSFKWILNFQFLTHKVLQKFTSLRRLFRINQCMYLSHSTVKSTFSLHLKRGYWLLLSKYTPKLCMKISVFHSKWSSTKNGNYVNIVWKISTLCTLTCKKAWFSYRLSSSWVNARSRVPHSSFNILSWFMYAFTL